MEPSDNSEAEQIRLWVAEQNAAYGALLWDEFDRLCFDAFMGNNSVIFSKKE